MHVPKTKKSRSRPLPRESELWFSLGVLRYTEVGGCPFRGWQEGKLRDNLGVTSPLQLKAEDSSDKGVGPERKEQS